jgi:beta-xylosidase
MKISRREALGATLVGTAAVTLGKGESADAASSGHHPPPGGRTPAPTWRRGFDNQRVADLGNGSFLNPLISGDHPDPTILKDGLDYYLTFSTFDSYPGLVIWHSRDLVNWRPVTAALTKNVGSVWAPELTKHNGRYFLYLPVKAAPNTIYVIWADNIKGPWSEPIDLRLPNNIDPGPCGR